MRTKKLKTIAILLLFLLTIGTSTVSATNLGTIKDVDLTQDSATTVDVEVTYNVNFTGTVYIEARVYDGSTKIGDEEDSHIVSTADTNIEDTVSVTFTSTGLKNGDKITVKISLKEKVGLVKITLDTAAQTFTYSKTNTDLVIQYLPYIMISIVGLAVLVILCYYIANRRKGLPPG